MRIWLAHSLGLEGVQLFALQIKEKNVLLGDLFRLTRLDSLGLATFKILI